MPVVKPTFQSESRLEGTSQSGSHSYALVPNFHLGLLALTAVVGSLYMFNIFYNRRRTQSTPRYAPSNTKVPDRHFAQWDTEKSRGVSIPRAGDTMSAQQQRPATPFSSQGGSTHVGWSARTMESKEDVVPDVLNAEKSGGLVLGSPVTSPVEQQHHHWQQAPPPPRLYRPPPPPPLSLPAFSPTVFALDDRRRGFHPPVPSSPIDTESFIRQPNPDYSGDSSSSSTAVAHATAPSSFQEAPGSANTTPRRRRSYAKTVSFDSAISGIESSAGEFATHPSSLAAPTASPPLPPPAAEFPETAPSAAAGHAERHQVDIQGEILTSVDEAGRGWTRHTRVYGGGVCLACLQSGGDGGFYGENVRPEDRR